MPLAAYSGFGGHTVQADATARLADWLRDRAIEEVHVVGIATDYTRGEVVRG